MAFWAAIYVLGLVLSYPFLIFVDEVMTEIDDSGSYPVTASVFRSRSHLAELFTVIWPVFTTLFLLMVLWECSARFGTRIKNRAAEYLGYPYPFVQKWANKLTLRLLRGRQA
jgi:hypothetical protein